MTRGALRCALWAGALGLAVPAAAQTAPDRTRLDEFTVPAGDSAQPIDQLDRTQDAVPSDTVTQDRELAVPGPPSASPSPVAQLSRLGEAPATSQVSNPAQSRQLGARSVSSPRDSRPQATAALGGRDRCAPGSQAERDGQCQRIIERRADEFAASEPPRLSAEQILIARLRNDEAAASNPARQRSRGAANPDAGELGNQEIASIYLQPAPAPAPADQAAATPDAQQAIVAQLLQGLQVQTTTTVPAAR